MGWRMLRRLEKRGRVGENYEKEVAEIYELDSSEDFDAFLVAFKRRGGLVIERRGGLAFYFTVEGVEVTRRPPTATGRLQVVATLTLSLLTQSPELKAPWELAPYAFQIATRSVEETTSQFYPGTGDLLYPHGSWSAAPLCNTAGTRIPARTSAALTTIRFSYNVPVSGFDSRLFWAAQGKINLSTIVVCGMTFPPRTIRLESFNARYETERVETTDALGSPTTRVWKYYRIDVGLVANPRSYDRLYANTGSHVRRGATLARIWRWTVSGTPRYGTYQEYQASGARDGEPLSEHAPLTARGDAVAPIATWRVGSPYEPVEFDALGLPEEGPAQWTATL